MRKEIFEIGKTVDSAIDSACEKLGCLREECEWEIIDLPKKGFLGLKNTPAKVRVSIEIPDAPPPRHQKPPEQKPVSPLNTRKTEKVEKPKPEKPRQEKPKPEQKTETRPEMKQAAPQGSESIGHGELTEKEKLAREYLSQIIGAAGLQADFVVTREHGNSCINIVGEGLGMIIGRRGDTLDAIQYLTGLAANRGDGEYLRLTVDCGNYRLKRKETLETLAKKLADQVLKTNVSKVLEPMNPFERRVIHATVSGIEGVSSSSVGEEPARRVVITSPTARPAPRGGYRDQRREGYGHGRAPKRSEYGDSAPRTDGERQARPPRDGGDGYDRSRRGRDDRRGGGRPPVRRSAPVPQGPPKQTPESEVTSGISIGKIDLE